MYFTRKYSSIYLSIYLCPLAKYYYVHACFFHIVNEIFLGLGLLLFISIIRPKWSNKNSIWATVAFINTMNVDSFGKIRDCQTGSKWQSVDVFSLWGRPYFKPRPLSVKTTNHNCVILSLESAVKLYLTSFHLLLLCCYTTGMDIHDTWRTRLLHCHHDFWVMFLDGS